jgi:hypothetical protein
MIEIDLDLLRVYRVGIGFIWFEPRLGKSRRQPFDGASRSLDRPRCPRGPDSAVPKQPRQCRGILRDDLAYATRVIARSTLRSDDESPRPSMRDLIEEASRLFSDTLEFDEPSKFVRLYALIERLRLFASAKVRQPLKFPSVWLPFKGVRR